MAAVPRGRPHAGELAAPVAARVYEGRAARVHGPDDPLEYPDRRPPQNRQYRDAAELRRINDQLQRHKPFTLIHPPDLISVLVAKGQDDQADIVGEVIGAHIDGDHVVVRILVTDPRAWEAIDDGMHELSLGYTSRQDARGYQRQIEVDHLALVPRARCGPSCALRVDCAGETACSCTQRTIGYGRLYSETGNADDVLTANEPVPDDHDDHGLPKDLMDESQKQLVAALKDAAEQRARADRAETELRTAKDALTAAQTDAANAKADLSAEKKKTAAAEERATQAEATAKTAQENAKHDAASSMPAAVTAKVKLLTEANRVLGDKDADNKTVDRTSMDDVAIQLAVITQVDGTEFVNALPDAQKKNPVFVSGLYTGALARFDAAASSRAGVRTLIQSHREAVKTTPAPVNSDGVPVDAETRERQAMIARNSRS